MKRLKWWIVGCAIFGPAALAQMPRSEEPALATIKSWQLDPANLRELYVAAAPARAVTSLAVAVLADAGWSEDRAAEVVREAALILSRCGLRVTRVDFQLVDAPRAYRVLWTPASRRLAARLKLARPSVYLVRGTLNQPAFEAEAFGRGNSLMRPELTDSVWLTADVPDPGIALAHELAHVLMDSGEHSDEPDNLMRAETAPPNLKLSDAQCERMLRTAIANRLAIIAPMSER